MAPFTHLISADSPRAWLAGVLLLGAAEASAEPDTNLPGETREVQQPAVRLGLGARLQFDVAEYDDDGGTDMGGGSRVRRARLTVDADVYEHWEIKLAYDFSREEWEGLRDAYVAYTGWDGARITAGHFKEPFSMERKTSVRDLPFMERSLVSALAPLRHAGVEYQYTGSNWTAAAGAFGRGAEESGTNTGHALSGRMTFAPSREPGRVRHVGASVTHRTTSADRELRFSSRPESRTTDTRLVDTGTFAADAFTTYGLELAASAGPLSLQAEYVFNQVDRDAAGDVRFRGWYVQAGWFLTGERQPYDRGKATFGTVTPLRSVGRGGLGAWQLAARLSDLDLNDRDIEGGHERNFTLALSWHLTRMFRVTGECIRVLRVQGGPFDGAEPTVWQARFQFAY